MYNRKTQQGTCEYSGEIKEMPPHGALVTATRMTLKR